MNANSSIKTWAEEDRPREKMIAKGREVLTNAELLAILMGSGSRSETAVQLAQRILSEVDSLNELGRKDLEFLMKFKGIGEAKAISIAAALELGRRRQAEAPQQRPQISSSYDAYSIIGPLLEDIPHEEFWIILLNRRNEVISKEKISSGGVSATVVDSKLVFKPVISRLASSIILVHNHPSGRISPSNEDIALTKKLKEAGKLLDIKILDHLIIGNRQYYSFLDEGKI